MSLNSEIASISLNQMNVDDDFQIHFSQNQSDLIDLTNDNNTESNECDFDQILSESNQYTEDELFF